VFEAIVLKVLDCSAGELQTPIVEAGIPVAACPEAKSPGALRDLPPVPAGAVISSRVHPVRQ